MIEVKKGDVFGFDDDENCENIQELVDVLTDYNGGNLSQEFITWCEDMLNGSYVVQDVFNEVTMLSSLKKEGSVFYNIESEQLNIPTPFANVWVSIPVENMKKIDLS